MISIDEFTRAFQAAQSVLEEHGVPAADYLNLDDDSKRQIESAASKWIDRNGLMTSRVALRRTLVDFMEVGVLIGVELSRGQIADAESGVE